MTRMPMRLMSVLTGVAFLSVSCATMYNSDHQSVRIFSTPSEARVTVDGQVHLWTAGTVSLSRFEDHVAVIEKDGYEPMTIKIERGMSSAVWWNLWCLMFVYVCVKNDRKNGGFWEFDDDIHVTLTKRADATPPPPHTP